MCRVGGARDGEVPGGGADASMVTSAMRAAVLSAYCNATSAVIGRGCQLGARRRRRIPIEDLNQSSELIILPPTLARCQTHGMGRPCIWHSSVQPEHSHLCTGAAVKTLGAHREVRQLLLGAQHVRPCLPLQQPCRLQADPKRLQADPKLQPASGVVQVEAQDEALLPAGRRSPGRYCGQPPGRYCGHC